MFLGFC